MIYYLRFFYVTIIVKWSNNEMQRTVGTLRTTHAGNAGNAQVEVGVHVDPICAGHIDTAAHPVPLFGASIVFTGVRVLLAACTRRIFIG